MKNILKFCSVLIAGLFLAIGAPAFAADNEAISEAEVVNLGAHLLAAGNSLDIDAETDDVLFAFGNQVALYSKSEYGIVAGNLVKYKGRTDKDLFIAGNVVEINESADIGRDVYAAASEIAILADLPGNLSVAAAKIVISGANIAGDVNLFASTIILQDSAHISGTLTYNDDAKVYGLPDEVAAQVSTYATPTHETTAAELWLSKFMSMISLFVVMLILALLLPGLGQRLSEETSADRFGHNLLSGLGLIFAIPLLALMFLMSYFAAAAGFVVLVIYLLAFYLSRGFASAWLGKLIVEKLFHSKLPFILETLIGILIFGCLSMIPVVSAFVILFTPLIGFGTMFACIHPNKKPAVPVATAPVENPFRGGKTLTAKASKPAAKAKAPRKASPKPAKKSPKEK